MQPLTDEEIAKLRVMIENYVHLTPTEMEAMRSIIEADKRMKWLMAGIRNVAIWIVGVIGGIALTYETLVTAVKHLAGK